MVEVRICDKAGAELPVGEVGEICVRSELVMAGYWRDPEATAKAIRDGGCKPVTWAAWMPTAT